MHEKSTQGSLLQKPIAIIGMACRLPGGDNLEEFWQLLHDGRSSVAEIPSERLDRELYYSPARGVRGKTYSKIGGLIKDRPLDLTLCPFGADDLRNFDPCHLIMCEVAAAACRNAGFDPRDLPHRNTGVYIGHSGGSTLASELVFATLAAETVEYLRDSDAFAKLPALVREEVLRDVTGRLRHGRPSRSQDAGPSIDANAIAHLIAKTLGCRGPYMAIDAACASSLVALSIGAMAVQSEQVDMAIVGGASFNKADSLILFSQAQSCSATGSRPFDEQADGLISSEGYVAVVLKSLERAVADGDRVDAVIRGIGISTDGRGKSLWAPRKEGQVEALRRAYTDEVEPSSIQYLEAHATSTPIGDATEMDALAAFFAPALGQRRIPVGSVKSNIGHTLETAGLASLIKTVLAMKQAILPPSIHCQEPSSAIPWERIPFYVSTEAVPWPSPTDRPKRAGVNAFGIGGLNVHIVVDEFVESTSPRKNVVVRDRRPSQPAGAAFHAKAQDPIALIGRGLVLPGASSVDAFVDLVLSGESMIGAAPDDRWKNSIGVGGDSPSAWQSPTNRGGFIREYEFDWKTHRIPPKQIARANPLQFMLLDAARQSLREAGYDRKEFERQHTAVVIGTIFGGEFGNQLVVGLRWPEILRAVTAALRQRSVPAEQIARLIAEYEDVLLRFKPALLDETGSFTSSTLASRVSKELNLMGGAMAIDAAECSSLASLDVACNLLRTGACSYVLCAGAQRAMDLVQFESLALRRHLQVEENSDDGFVPGEGVAMLLLKRLADAQRDSDRIFGVIRGVHGAFDPHNFVQTAVTPLTKQFGHTLAASGAVALVRATLPDKTELAADRPIDKPFAINSYATSGLAYHAIGEKCATEFASQSPINVRERKPETATPAPERPRVAFLFPGQGSQYAGMLRSLAQTSPSARATIAEADEVMRGLGCESFAELAWGGHDKLGTDIWSTQVAMLLADTILFRELVARGVRPDVISGHSFGEFPALVAAGVCTLEQAIRLTRARADAIQFADNRSENVAPQKIGSHEIKHGAMLSIAAHSRDVESIARRHQCEVFVTHFNAPEQTVVGGEEAEINRFAEILTTEKMPSQRLRVPCAFHTPLMRYSQDHWRTALAAESLRPPAIPLLSCVTNRYVAEPDEIKQNLVAQLTNPVRYVQLVERLADEGAKILVEVGPNDVLTKLNRRILDNRDVTCIAANRLQTDDNQQLENVVALLASFGLAKRNAAVNGGQNSREVVGEILRFDATTARRERLRRLATSGGFMPAPGPVIHDSESFDATALRNRPTKNGNTHRAATRESKSNGDVARAPQRSMADDQLEQFLLDFMVEQTGYPADIIELDWEFEADLGIDSIKKAQMFGELGELFDLTAIPRHSGPGDTFSLDQFRTLRQVLDLIRSVARQPTSRQVGSQPATKIAPAQTVDNDGLEAFLINFVVEQTGYPADIVDLDAEFEADLGIDSIKLAQLFGELSEHFSLDLDASNRVELGEFRTLRNVVERLRKSNSSRSKFVADAASVRQQIPAMVYADAGSVGHVDATGDHPHLHSEHYQVGFARGRDNAQLIGRELRRAADRPLEWNDATSAHALDAAAHFTQSELDELHGVADGAAVHVGNVLAYNLEQRNGESSPLRLARAASNHATTQCGEQSPVTSRYVLRMTPSPQRSGVSTELKIAGSAAIVGANEVGTELQIRLTQSGVTAYLIPTDGDPARAVLELERIWNLGPISHLFILTPHDADAATSFDLSNWTQRRARGVMTPFWVCQKWLKLVQEAHLMDDAALVGVTMLGGQFGFDGQVTSAEGGALTGLMKAIKIESWVNGHRTFPVKVIDASPNESASNIVDSIFRELAVPSYDLEIAWPNGVRQVVQANEEPLQGSKHKPIPHGGTWVCTGGARGITAFVSRELAQRFQLKLHLIGAAPPPNLSGSRRDLSPDELRQLKMRVMTTARQSGHSPMDAWEKAEKELEIDATLRQLAALGIEATYHSCDVSDPVALERVLDEVRQTSGPIEGVLHGAGVGKDARFENKDPRKVDQCIQAKVDGTLALMDLTRQDPLKYFVAFGSISGRFGANGHTDYSLANDMLAKLVDWYRCQRPEVAAVAFHWHAWGDVGMATKPETRLALDMIGMQFMPAREGLDHLIRELEAGAPEGEVLITDDKYHRLFFPSESLTPSNAPISDSGDDEPPCPLLDRGQSKNIDGQQIFSLELDPTVEPFLLEHRLDDKPLLPLVIGIELLCEAAARLTGKNSRLCLREIDAAGGLRFFSDKPQTVNIHATRVDDATLSCRLLADFKSRDGKLVEADRVYMTGLVDTKVDGPAATDRRPSVPNGQWHPVAYPDRGSAFYLGPSLRCLRKIQMGDAVAWGRIIAPSLIELVDSKQSVAGWIVPSAALDACLYATGLLAWRQVKPGTALPSKIGRLQLGRRPQPGEACLVETRLLDVDDRRAFFNFSLFGDDGATILEVEGYQIVWLAG